MASHHLDRSQVALGSGRARKSLQAALAPGPDHRVSPPSSPHTVAARLGALPPRPRIPPPQKPTLAKSLLDI